MATVCHKQARISNIHEQLGHLVLHSLKILTMAGIIPKEVANVDAPRCPGCAYGKAHSKPTWSKGINNKKWRKPTTPGQVISVDKLVSPTPGFIKTKRRIPTTQCYVGTTVFVDHFYNFIYILLIKKLDGISTVKSKHTFECVWKSHSVTVQNYHSYKRLFGTKILKYAVSTANQTLSCFGVNDHHQNGKAENFIKDVTTREHKSLLHVAHRWPEAMNIALWQATFKKYTNIRKSVPI